MKRKAFIQHGLMATLPILMPADRLLQLLAPDDYVMTVNGRIPGYASGLVLSHEHLMVDFIGADQVSPSRYTPTEVFEKVLPYLQEVYAIGVRTFVDCTPEWLGRDVKLLQQLSNASGMHIITNTGYYGASGGKFLPAHAHTESVEQLAARWIGEWKNGISGTSIRPGFIKTGVDRYPLSEVQRKLIRAAALTHLETGLAIFVHTGDGQAALEELSIIQDAGVAADAWIWTHAQGEPDREIHKQVANAGGWIAFDGFYPQLVDQYIVFLKDMKTAGLLHRVLLSHDAGWYEIGKPRGGVFRPFTAVFEYLIPALEKAAFTTDEINQLFKTNPARALAVQVRKPAHNHAGS